MQQRLNGEPLEEYILPVGGGFFSVLPGVRATGGFLGQGLLTPDHLHSTAASANMG